MTVDPNQRRVREALGIGRIEESPTEVGLGAEAQAEVSQGPQDVQPQEAEAPVEVEPETETSEVADEVQVEEAEITDEAYDNYDAVDEEHDHK